MPDTTTLLAVLGPTLAALSALAGVALSQWQARIAQREHREHDFRMQQLAWEREEHQQNTERRLTTYSEFLESCDVLVSRIRNGQPHSEASESFFAKYHRVKLIGSPDVCRTAERIQAHVKHLLAGQPRTRENRLEFLRVKGYFAKFARIELGLVEPGSAQPSGHDHGRDVKVLPHSIPSDLGPVSRVVESD